MAFQDDIAAAMDAFGGENLGIVWGLGMTPWRSDEDRDAFIQSAKELGGTGG